MNGRIIDFKLGKREGCYFDDEIYIVISPAWAEELSSIFKKRALDAGSYDSQGLDRIKADFFEGALREWGELREKKTQNSKEIKNDATTQYRG